MKRVGFFKRIGRPTRLGKLLVNTGDVIKADFDFIMEQLEGGWLVIQPNQQSKVPQPRPMTHRDTPKFVPKVEHTVDVVNSYVESLKNEENESITSVNLMYESIERQRKEELEHSNRHPVSIEVNIDKLRDLKKLTNKEWMTITKDQSIKLLTEANIDFSHVPKTKWELVRFIKGIIKDL
jgi:hypothetical protein